jgi:hypothetical protein
MVRKSPIFLVLAGLLAGCSGAVGGGSTPTPVVVVQHLYVGNDNTPGTVQAFTLPITASSTAAFAFASNNVVSIGFDANSDALVGDNAGHLQFFTAPLSASSTPSVTFTNGSATNNGQIVFNLGGQFFVGNTSTAVNLFTPPFTNSSAPSTVVSGGLVSAVGDVLDNVGNLYVANAGTGGGTGSDVEVFAAPYTGGPTVTTPNVAATAYRKMAGSGSTLYVCSVAGATGRIDAYGLPLTNTSAPAFAITTGVNVPEAIAFDQNGNMYVGNLGNSTITVYAPPFTAASAPSVTLTLPGTFAIFGIAVGR